MLGWLFGPKEDTVDGLAGEVFALRDKYLALKTRCEKLLSFLTDNESEEILRHADTVKDITKTHEDAMAHENAQHGEDLGKIRLSIETLGRNIRVTDKITALFE